MLSEAERKFWGCPELVESLLPFLDTELERLNPGAAAVLARHAGHRVL